MGQPRVLHDGQAGPLCECPPSPPQALGLFTETPPSTLKTFFTFLPPQAGHGGAASLRVRKSDSNLLPHFSHTNSYMGIRVSRNLGYMGHERKFRA
jgi:hypothetical protein